MSENPSVDNQIIVEIGPKTFPIEYYLGWDSFKKYISGSTYIAIDCDPKLLNEFKERFKRKAVAGSLSQLPLENNSVSQIWLMSVYGDYQYHPMILPDGTEGTIVDDFKELSRVVKKDGKIYIGELLAPAGWNEPEWLIGLDYSDYGLEKKVYKGPEEIISFLEKTAGGPIGTMASILREGDPEHAPFLIELTKK